MSNVTYVLVEVDDDLTEEEIKEQIEAANPSFFVAQEVTVTMESLEYSSPTIYFP
jgi:hypothetical protein